MNLRSPHSSFARTALVAAAIALASSAPAAFGCSECGCTLSSDWSAQGYPDVPGFTSSARFEYFDSNDLRSGAHGVAPGAIALPADQEIQRETLNRNTWLGLDYVGGNGWAVDAQLPYYDRYHSTIAEGDTAVSESRAAGVGDLRVVGRYQRFSLYRSYGLQFGLKLPTSRYDQTFATGPQAGALLDRGLQLGSGTTDLLAGASYFRRATPHIGWFAQALAQQPLAERDGFLPSANIAVNAGVRYLNPTSVVPQVQLNAHWDGREHGANADGANSGGTTVYVSPGVTVELGTQASACLFLQLPVYRRFNGLQLAPRAIVSLGLTYRL